MYLVPSDEAVDWLDARLRFDGTRFMPFGRSIPLMAGIFRWFEIENLLDCGTVALRIGIDSHELAVDMGPVDELTWVDFEWTLSFISERFCWLSCCGCCCCWWWWLCIGFVWLTNSLLLFLAAVALLRSWLFDMIWFALDMQVTSLTSTTFCTDLCGAMVGVFVVPLMAAIGFGMLVIVGAFVTWMATVAFGFRLAAVVEPVFATDDIFNLLSAAVFVWCVLDVRLSFNASVLLSFLSNFFAFNASRLPLFGAMASNFCFDFGWGISTFFRWLAGAGSDDARDVDWTPTPSFKLKLESLCSLRADEMPLLELVCFDMCILDERSIFSLWKNFNLSIIECFIGNAVPFISAGSLACIGCWLTVGILHLTTDGCWRKLKMKNWNFVLFLNIAVARWWERVKPVPLTLRYCISECALAYCFVATDHFPTHSSCYWSVHHFQLERRENEKKNRRN